MQRHLRLCQLQRLCEHRQWQLVRGHGAGGHRGCVRVDRGLLRALRQIRRQRDCVGWGILVRDLARHRKGAFRRQPVGACALRGAGHVVVRYALALVTCVAYAGAVPGMLGGPYSCPSTCCDSA